MDICLRDSTTSTPSHITFSGAGGVCLMRDAWKGEQHPSFINFIFTFLSANSFRLNIVPIAPDFIFNCGGLSVAFIFVTNWDCNIVSPIFNRVQKLKTQFARFYVVITLPAKEQIDSFTRSYFKFGMVTGKPTFVPVQDFEMGFEKMVKIAHSCGVYKQQRIVEKFKVERKQLVQGMDFYLKVVTSIPGLDNHDAKAVNHYYEATLQFSFPNFTSLHPTLLKARILDYVDILNLLGKLSQAIGSVQAIAKASKEEILDNTDLSTDKAEMVPRFLRDPKFYLSPKIN